MSGGPATDAQPGAVQWRLFLRAMADEIDGSFGAEARDTLLRGAGARMARLAPLSAVGTLDALEVEINDSLTAMGWGRASLAFDDTARELRITHHGLPRVGTAGDPPGTWLAALLEGLYETWLAQQPGAEPGLHARQTGETAPEQIRLRYARG